SAHDQYPRPGPQTAMIPRISNKNIDRAIPTLFLLAGGIICYGGTRILQLGFYHDDWSIFSIFYFAPHGFISAIKVLMASFRVILFRPGDILLYAAMYEVFGLHPLPWQLALFILNFLLSLTIYGILGKYKAPRWLALLGALVFL